ncbi:terminase large subunit domain-containing protein [Butyricicoccus sp. Marseille-Q5471]|uniref:terminase large subunit domain-containing protein n=1 Tax=Butyricicoccus sp. Marseille-Q5471 TaxID=3039493 RepID=UPI0024BD5156|nr:terminase family protein [Butyricicoccus sp. Marseille-Q5471]
MQVNFEITEKQLAFIEADTDEVMFGGAAGGGKTYVQVIDAWLKAITYPGIKQIIFRNTYPELKRTVIALALALYPQDIAKYNKSDHVWTFENGSTIEFNFLTSATDAMKFKSAEFDIVRFDELTHFDFDTYIYMMSRLRGANDFPKQIKSSTNPGGKGHYWVKSRFIDVGEPLRVYPAFNDEGDHVSDVIFIPAKIDDNVFIMQTDPDYKNKRMKALSKDDRRALGEGDWDVWAGQYFSEFRREIHVLEPFVIPPEWRRYRAIDYGLDMLACYWIAVDFLGRAYVYRELYESDLIIEAAAKRILEMTEDGEEIEETFAPKDLWSRTKDTGVSIAARFDECGVPFKQVSNTRIAGWYSLKTWLQPCIDEFGKPAAKLRIFSTCKNLIRTLPALVHDEKHVNDVATNPHELTHAPDAIRYFVDGQPEPAYIPPPYEPDEEAGIDFWEYGG